MRRALPLLLLVLASAAACATPNATSGEGTGERGRARWSTGLDAGDVTDVTEGVAATLVQLLVFTGCTITLQDECAMKAENAGRRAIGREPRIVDG